MMINLALLSFAILSTCFERTLGCVPKHYTSDSVVCVCNATYCDLVPDLPEVIGGVAAIYTSSRQGARLALNTGKMAPSTSQSLILEINRSKTRQRIIGFGGAFTDAAGINIASLPEGAQKNLMAAYFSAQGLQYNIGRIPMGSCDFSTHAYSYDDIDGDLQLTHFALAPEDLKFKIPYIQKAREMTQDNLRLFGSPWSAPAWMKTNKNMTGNGTLIGQPGGPYYKAWANYFVRFVQEYAKYNLSIWGLTTQNEPTDGDIYNFPFQAMGWSPETQRDFVKMDLGPALRKSGMQDINLMILDDNRLLLPYWPKLVLSDLEARQYVSGIAVHWYADKVAPANVLDFTHNYFPDIFVFGTEACNGFLPFEVRVILGDWNRGESYATDIIDDLNHWVTGWTDWNLALNLEGGPNWVSNFVDSPIIVNASSGEFYKQPMFYVMGHFSKFLIPGSVHIDCSMNASISQIYKTAFLRPDGIIVVLILNTNDSPYKLSLHDATVGFLDLTIPEKSIHTVLWKSK